MGMWSLDLLGSPGPLRNLCMYIYTEIPPSLSYLSDGLFNRLQCCEECLSGHQDIEPEEKFIVEMSKNQ